MDLKCQVSHVIEGRYVSVTSPYSATMVKEYRKVGGKWKDGKWILPLESGIKFIEEMFGVASELVIARVNMRQVRDSTGEIIKKEKTWRDGNEEGIGGYVIARRAGRDRKADIWGDLVQGTVPSNGGSVKNPTVDFSMDAEIEIVVRRDFAESRDLKIVWPPEQPEQPEQPPDLSGYTTAQLLFELKKRGIPVPTE